MILLFSISGLCMLNAVMPSIVGKIVSYITKMPQNHMDLRQQVVDLKNDLKQISMVDNFATYAKTQRKINKLETEIKKESDENSSKFISMKITITTVLKIVLGLILLFCTLYYRYTPVIVLPDMFNLSPLEKILSFPTNQGGAISVPIWIVISKSITRYLSQML